MCHKSLKFKVQSAKLSDQAGQTLLELIVVVMVSVIVIGALVFATIASLRNAQFAKNQAQATKLTQEGIEKVRTSRNRTLPIINIPSSSVTSWNGDSSSGICTGTTNINADSIWCYQIYNGCGSGVSGTACYFKLASNNEAINWIISSTVFPSSSAEDIYGDGKFKRAIIINDDSDTYRLQKTVTVIVTWTDFSGPHESKLTTILRKT